MSRSHFEKKSDMTQEEFTRLVKKMRDAQKAYDRVRRTQFWSVANRLLIEAKALETEVDAECIKTLNPSSKEIQTDLFG